MTTTPNPPATDEEIAQIGAWNCDCSTKGPNHPWQCLMVFGPRLEVRIEQDRATIREQNRLWDEREEKFRDAIDKEVNTLRATIATQTEEIKRRKARVDLLERYVRCLERLCRDIYIGGKSHADAITALADIGCSVDAREIAALEGDGTQETQNKKGQMQ